MYPLSSVTSSVADFVGAPDGEDGGGNKGATAKSDDLQQAELTPPTTSTALTTPTTSTALTTTVVKRVSTKGNGRAPAKNVDLDVFSSLGVALSPESTRIVEGIIIKVDALARRIYRSVIAKQLPSHVSKKLTVTGRGIWYFTYRLMCEDSFVSKCIGEYHYKHRPGFIRDLPRIQVFSDGSLVSLTGGGLLDFLSRLDGAIYNRIKSVFGSCWSEVSVTLEGESLSAVSCKDFIDALTIAGIPPVVMSLASVAAARCKVRARSKVTVECAASGVSTTDLTHSLPSGSQSLPPQPHTEFLSSVHSQSESRAGPSLPSEEASYTSSELIVPFSVGDSGGGSSSDLIAAKRHKDGGVYVPTGTDAVVIPSAVGVPPISSEANTLTSSAISSSSPCVSLSVQCVDLSGIELHPDSAELINKLFQGIRKSARKSFSSSMINYILTILSSELSPLEKAIWFKTYKELHLSKFMFKFACIYYYRYHIDFIRGLDDVRVLSSSSDRRLVPLGGVGLLNFLSRLRCAIRGEVRSTFNSEWDEVADKVFSDSVLEGESLSTLSCKDFIRVLDVVGVPVVALPISQRYYTTRNRRFAIRKREMLGSGSRSAVEGSGSSSVPHLQSETLPGSSSATTTSTTAAATGKKMGTRGKGKASARKRGTSAVAVSSSSAVSIGEVVAAESARGRFSAQKSAVALDCASLCAMVLPECALMIK
ncbi:hypothetical protein, partial [Candidatus Ichthyocystis hellenicum]|uniref:hypothetical protein n=3 Tax=Candidatus Ichthyocystis TaxID=2929841 RepID=UPI0011121040